MPLSKTFVNDCNEDISLFLPRRERFVTSSNQLDPLKTVETSISPFGPRQEQSPQDWVTTRGANTYCQTSSKIIFEWHQQVFSLFLAMTKCIRDKSKSVCLCCELNSFFIRNLRKKLTWWTCHEVVNLNPALKNKVSFVCDDTCGIPGLGRGEYSSNIRVKESRWGFETLTQFRTTKTLKIHTLFRTNAKMKAVLF